MGYQMAKNLQSRLSPSDSIHLFDINKDAVHRLAKEMEVSQAGGATVKVAESVSDAAKDAVSLPATFSFFSFRFSIPHFYDEHVLSMI